MGHRLRTVKVDQNSFLSEKACENYRCRSCGKPMISVNFVNGICIQVFVSHGENCTCFIGNAFRRTAEVTCETCRFYRQEQNSCGYMGEEDQRIGSVRTTVS